MFPDECREVKKVEPVRAVVLAPRSLNGADLRSPLG